MKILQINNYFFVYGGAERVAFEQKNMLEENGHEVIDFAMHHSKNLKSKYEKYFIKEVNTDFNGSFFDNIINAAKSFYNAESRRKIKELIEKEKPDIVQIHNITRRISFSIIDEIKKHDIPIVYTLHDYKPICAKGNLYRSNGICEKCIGGNYFNILRYSCIRNRFIPSFADSLEKYFSIIKKTYKKIDKYITPSAFLKKKLIQGGLRGDNITVLHNFVEAAPENGDKLEDYALYAGRIDESKGVITLLETIKDLNIPLKLAGDGKLLFSLRQKYKKNKQIVFLGHLEKVELNKIIKKAKFIVVPSEWYENCSMAILEAMSLGKVVLCSNIGGNPELVEDGKSGFLFKPGDKNDLLSKINMINSLKESEIKEIGENARKRVIEKFNPKQYYKNIISIYEEAINK